MLYKVRGTPIKDRLSQFYELLTDGTIQDQKPDGYEIVASMKRARITAPGVLEWFETCYCPTPLLHERTTVYDRFFSRIETEEADRMLEIDGTSFWEFLQIESDDNSNSVA